MGDGEKKIISFHHQIQITRFHQNGWLRLCVLQKVGGGRCLDDGALVESFPQLMNLASISFKKKFQSGEICEKHSQLSPPVKLCEK